MSSDVTGTTPDEGTKPPETGETDHGTTTEAIEVPVIRDPAKTLELLEKLRKNEKRYLREIADREAKITEFERSKLDETERLKVELEEARSTAAQAQAALEAVSLRQQFEVRALAAGVRPEAVADAFYSAKEQGLLRFESGEVVGVADTLEAFRTSKAFYFKEDATGTKPNPVTPPAATGSGALGASGVAPVLSAEEAMYAQAAGMSPDEYVRYRDNKYVGQAKPKE